MTYFDEALQHRNQKLLPKVICETSTLKNLRIIPWTSRPGLGKLASLASINPSATPYLSISRLCITMICQIHTKSTAVLLAVTMG